MVDQARVTVPEAALEPLIQSAPVPAGVSLSASLEPDRIVVSIRASLLRFRVGFRPTVEGGRLVLTPAGGVPGVVLGLAAGFVSGLPGVALASDGRVTVDPRPLVPEGIELPIGITAVDVTPDRITFVVG